MERDSTQQNESKGFRFSLRARVALGVALPIFVILTLLSVFHYTREYRLLNQQTRLHAAHLGELMIQSLNHAMLTKEDSHLFSSVADVSQIDSVEQIQIIGLSGVVLANSGGQTENHQFNLNDEECQSCHQYAKGEMPRAIAYPQLQDGLRVSTPIDNAPQCFECHGETTAHLGVLLMDVTMTEQQTQILKDLRIGLLISAVSTILVSVGSYYFVHGLVVRRIEALKEPMDRFAQGDFSVRIHDVSRMQDELSMLVETFNHMADELEQNALLEEERQFLREQAIVDERERIARELHDGLAQVLGYVNTKAIAVRLMLENKRFKEAERHLGQLEDAAQGLFLDVREAILGLKMTGLVDAGLITALTEYTEQFSSLSGIPVKFSHSYQDGGTDLPPEVELQLFRIVQESLTNIRKHSLANHAKVTVDQSNGSLDIVIDDDGVGFSVVDVKPEQGKHLGLVTMRERSEEIGASLKIDSNLGKGTRILVKLPLTEAQS